MYPSLLPTTLPTNQAPSIESLFEYGAVGFIITVSSGAGICVCLLMLLMYYMWSNFKPINLADKEDDEEEVRNTLHFGDESCAYGDSSIDSTVSLISFL